MLRKAREKAKEGLRSVNAETKRYLQRHNQNTGGHGRPRQPTNSAGAASMSFKGVNIEAIMDDEYDFTNQFDQTDELEASGSSMEGHVASHFGSPAANIGQTETKDQSGSDLFTDPLFPESECELHNADVSVMDDIDPPPPAEDRPQTTPAIHVGDNRLEGESPAVAAIDTITIPKPEDPLLSESGDSVSPSSDNAVIKQGVDDIPVAPPLADEQEPLRSDSPLFSDDPIVGEKNHEKDDTNDDKRLRASIFVTQPSDECLHDLPQRMEISEEELFGEKCPESMEDDQPLALPDLPDIEELERKLALKTVGGQDIFSSEDSMFSSLASSYEGDKGDEIPHITAARSPLVDLTERASHIKSGHDESELFSEVVSVVEREVHGSSMGDQKTSDSEHQKVAQSNEEELELLLTPKQKPSREADVSSSDVSNHNSASQVMDDPLHSSQVVESRKERTGSHLDSGVFEQSMQKSTPEREAESGLPGEDLFVIDEDHFKDNDDSTPVPVRRPFTKDLSSVEVAQSKKVLNSTLSAPILSPPDVGGTTSNPPKKANSGKAAPPPRPAMSPKLRHRMIQLKQQSGSSSAGTQQQQEDMIHVATKKIIQPLGRECSSRDAHDHSPVKWESSDTTLRNSETIAVVPRVTPNGSNTSPLPSKNDERRIPADDLFLEDSNLISPNEGMGKLPAKAAMSQPSEKPDMEQGEPSPEDEEETDYFLYHILFSLCLYFYYSLNIFPYLSGFFAGFFVLYLTVGSVFIFYVQTVEKYQSGDGSEDRMQEPSQEFTESMHVDFENLSVYKSNKFTATLTYDPATHHPSQRMKVVVNFTDDFQLYVRVQNDHTHSHGLGPLVDVMTDIRRCKIDLVPQEVAKNRKRRWSKKFPIMIFNPPPNTYRVFLFSPHAREKEDWYRRLKSANHGYTSKQVIRKEMRFFSYMEGYFPRSSFPTMASASSRSSLSKRQSRHGGPPRRQSVPRVRYSVNQESDDTSRNEFSESVSFRASSAQRQSSTVSRSSVTDSSISEQQLSHTRLASSSSVDSEFEVIPCPPKVTRLSQLWWLNAVAARLCWDIWHEQRWKDWVMTKIQRKLIRVKTPSFMEQLRLTDVSLGNDMPVVQQLRDGPKLDLKGIWVYLDVNYTGNFVMTIETKMRFGKDSQVDEPDGQQMTTITKSKEAGLPQSAPHRSSDYHHSLRSSGKGLTHQYAAKALGTSVDPYDQEIDSGSDDEESATGIVVNPLEVDAASAMQSQEPQDHSMHLPGGRKEKIISMVSKITKKVASARIVQRAAQKVSSYPLVLTVEVKGLDGILVVNIPPPPTDTIWWGFKSPPKLSLVAKPRLGNREVKLSRVTHWIERKLQELVNKKLVLPEMEDLVIPVLNSGIPEDELKPISSDSAPS